MTAPNSRREFFVALLIAAWAHVGLFFLFVVLVVFDLLSAKVIEQDDLDEEKDPPIKMQMVYEEGAVSEPVIVPEVVPEVEAELEPVMPETPAFVQTDESQASEKAPDETELIGERNTLATSDEGAVAGDEKMSALSGTEEMKSDPKTFDSNFSEGEISGLQEGEKNLAESGEGEDQETEKAEEAVMVEKSEAEPQPEPELAYEPLPEMEEELPEPKEDELASIEETLAALEEAIGDDKKEEREQKKPIEKVEETMPEKPAVKAQEAAAQDGGFAPKATKTRVAGIFNSKGKGSLNVADTAAGRYEASILKKLETAWQMDNINNRPLNAPGQITLYFAVNQKGQVSHQKHVSRVGASDNQWGRILGVVDLLAIPKMPKEVIRDLKGEALELIVTFNY